MVFVSNHCNRGLAAGLTLIKTAATTNASKVILSNNARRIVTEHQRQNIRITSTKAVILPLPVVRIRLHVPVGDVMTLTIVTPPTKKPPGMMSFDNIPSVLNRHSHRK